MSHTQPSTHLLTIDIGNSSLKLCAFAGETLQHRTRFDTSDSPHSTELVTRLRRWATSTAADWQAQYQFTPTALAYCSVTPSKDEPLILAIGNAFQLPSTAYWRIEPDQIKTPVNLNNYPAEHLGADRLVNVCATRHLIPNTPIIAVDFGTATTFDVIDADGNFHGGCISPGIETFWKSLALNTDRLPETPVTPPANILGKNSTECIQSGLSLGYVGLYRETITRLQTQLAETTGNNTPATVIWTGGGAEAFNTLSHGEFTDITAQPNLTLNGIQQLYALNHQV